MSDLDERLREGRQALGAMDPPADLWARALERADSGDAEVQDSGVDGRRRPGRLLVAAAAAALVVLVGTLVLAEDDQTVDTVPVTEDHQGLGPVPTSQAPSVEPPGMLVSGHGCPFGIAGEPIDMRAGPVDPLAPRFDPEPGQNIAHTLVGEQVAEVRVPGFELMDPSGWRMEDIQLSRGTASLWLDGPPSGEQGKPFVQVRWFPPAEEPCGSFTVTVDGGTDDANRQLAVDLAERLVLPSELGDGDLPGSEGGPVAGLELAGTEWRIVSTSSGSPPSGARMSFTDTTVTWDDGCLVMSADYELDRVGGFLALTVRNPSRPRCTPPTLDGAPTYPGPVVGDAMGSDRVTAAFVLDRDPSARESVTGLLRLGDHPQGPFLLLAPA